MCAAVVGPLAGDSGAARVRWAAGVAVAGMMPAGVLLVDAMVAGVMVLGARNTRYCASGRGSAGHDQDCRLPKLAEVAHPHAIGGCSPRSEADARRLDTEGMHHRAPALS